MTDKQRLDWLEAQEGCALVSDEAGSWAVAMFGMQNVPVDFPSDIEARYLIEKQDWQSSIL